MVSPLSSPLSAPVRPPEATRERGLRRFLMASILILSGVAVSQVLYYLVVAPRLVLQVVEAPGAGLTEEQVLRQLGVRKGTPYYLLDEAELQRRLMLLPEVRNATVQKRFPNALVVQIDRRQPVGMILEPGSGTTWLVDREGVVFPKEGGIRLDYPILSGLRREGGEAVQRVDKRLTPFLEDLHRVMIQEPTLFELISEIRLEPQQSAHRAVVSLIHTPVKVVFAQRLTVAELRQALLFLDLIRKASWEREVKMLDMRSQTPVFRREGRS